MSDKGTTAEERMTDGGIFIIGDDVIHDGEAESLGVPPKTKAPRHPVKWPDHEDD